MTKLILNQNVEKLGAAGDVVIVKPGFARNYLLPKSIAIMWTSRAESQIKLTKAAVARRKIENEQVAEEIKEKLESGTITLVADTSSSGKLFGAITAIKLVDAVKEQFGFTIDKRKVVFNTPIKNTGLAIASIGLLGKIEATVKLNVIPTPKKKATV
jgi:large subunit ribosomal protein L9